MKKTSVTMLMLKMAEEGLSKYGIHKDTSNEMRDHAQDVVYDLHCLIPPIRMMKSEMISKPLVKLLMLFVLKPPYMGKALDALSKAMDGVIEDSLEEALSDIGKCETCEDKDECDKSH
jgi:hypothetical protein